MFRFLILLIFLIPYPAQGNNIPCDIREKIIDTLINNYNEKQISTGLANSGNVIEIFGSDSGTWTVLITSPNGISCMLASGKNWEIQNGQPI